MKLSSSPAINRPTHFCSRLLWTLILIQLKTRYPLCRKMIIPFHFPREEASSENFVTPHFPLKSWPKPDCPNFTRINESPGNYPRCCKFPPIYDCFPSSTFFERQNFLNRRPRNKNWFNLFTGFNFDYTRLD